MRIQKIILCLSFVFGSCAVKHLQSNEAYKRINYPGLATSKPFVMYTIKFNSDSDFSLQDVKLNKDITVNYDVYSNKDKAIVKSLKNLKRGNYTISFKTNAITKIANQDFVTIHYKVENKDKIQQFNIEKKDPIRRK